MKSVLLFSFFFSCNFLVGQSNLSLDSLKSIGAQLRVSRQWKEADSVYREALIVAEFEGNLEEQSLIHNNLNNTLFQMGNYKEALKESEKELEISLKLGNDTIIAGCYYNLGLNLKKMRSFKLANDNFLRAIVIYEMTDWEEGLAKTYNALGNLHRHYGSYGSSLKYHFSALKFYEKLNNAQNIARSYHNLGRTYADSGLFDIGMSYLLKAKEINQSSGFSISINNSQIGSTYLEIGKLDSADRYLNMAMNQRNSEGSLARIATSHILLTQLYNATGNSSRAEFHADTAYSIALDLDLKEELIEIIELQIILEKPNGNYEGLVTKYEKLFQLKEEVSWDNEQMGSAQIEAEYRALKKSQEIAIRDTQLELQVSENEKLSIRNTAFLIGFIIAAFFVGVIILFYLKLVRSKKETEKKNVLLKKSNQLIDSLHKELSHRTKNYYSMFGGILKYDKKRTDNTETKKLLNNYIQRVEAMSQIQRYLLDENSPSHEVQLDLYLSDLLSNIDLVLNKGVPEVKILKHFETLSCDYDKALRIGLVMNEMVSNAFEHGLNGIENPELEVSLIGENNGVIHLEIVDNGRGFEQSSAAPEKSSLGIGLMDMILKSVEGELSYNDKSGAGTSVKIKVLK